MATRPKKEDKEIKLELEVSEASETEASGAVVIIETNRRTGEQKIVTSKKEGSFEFLYEERPRQDTSL